MVPDGLCFRTQQLVRLLTFDPPGPLPFMYHSSKSSSFSSGTFDLSIAECFDRLTTLIMEFPLIFTKGLECLKILSLLVLFFLVVEASILVDNLDIGPKDGVNPFWLWITDFSKLRQTLVCIAQHMASWTKVFEPISLKREHKWLTAGNIRWGDVEPKTEDLSAHTKKRLIFINKCAEN